MTTDRYVCIHGHFYQPPRENPWLEEVEAQDSAYPYHDWNERITAECYEPNGASRILDGEGRIVRIVNNYARISFNFGPTLLQWLETKAPDVYRAILEADAESQARYGGHGSALAQVYNHMILPLANRRDKMTQVRWGIADFEHRFGRKPEGMWLAETAADLESLDVLAAEGIRFTILAPSQASRARRKGQRNWRDVAGGRIDPSLPYVQTLPSGRSIVLFFYDGPISQAVAFEGLLRQGERFAERLLGAFSEERNWPQIVHIATDGETYGHHHRHGDMALAYALQLIEESGAARLTNYAEYLSRNPATAQVEIFENSSWSCVHGVERWRSDCGCNSGGHPGWSQAWRAPLREAFDWLRDELAPRYETKAAELLRDPWAARDDYIAVILDRSPESLDRYFERHARRPLGPDERVVALKLLEMQRHAMLMYTSCGWFFDELSGIETVQVIAYAGRAVQLALQLFDEPAIEAGLLDRLERAKSNLPEHGDGRRIYEKWVRPAMVDWEQVGAHYAVSSLFEDYPERVRLYSYRFEREDHRSFEAGRVRFVLGRARVVSEITCEATQLSYGALHFGDHNVNAGVRKYLGHEAYEALVRDVAEPFARGDYPEVLRLLDREFGESTYSLKSLFRDEQRRVLETILETTLQEIEAVYRQVYEHHASTMRFVTDLGIPLPKALATAAEFVLNSQLRRALLAEEISVERVRSLLDAARAEGVPLDATTLAFAAQKGFEAMAERFFASPEDRDGLVRLEAVASLMAELPFEVDLWKVQNGYYRLKETRLAAMRARAEAGDAAAAAWVDCFVTLGERLRIRVDAP